MLNPGQGQRPKTLVQYIPPGKISTIEITPRQGLPLRKQSSLSNGEHCGKGRKKARKNSINTSTTTPLRIKMPFDQNRITGSNEGKEYHPACIDKYQQICGPYALGVPWELTKDNILTTPKEGILVLVTKS